MAIVTPAGFQITSTEPVDSRITLADSASRYALSPFNIYEGLIVYQQDNNTVYTLIDTSSVGNNAGWQELAGGGVTGGTLGYLAVWSGSTSLTTGSLYDDFSGRVGINTTPSYTLDIVGDLRVDGSPGYIYHKQNKTGVVPPTTVTSGSSATLLTFNPRNNSGGDIYKGLFFEYELEVLNSGYLQASRSGILKAAIFYTYSGTYYTAIQTNETTTQEFHIATSDLYVGTENVILALEFNNTGDIDLNCINQIGNSTYTAKIRGEWKLLPLS